MAEVTDQRDTSGQRVGRSFHAHQPHHLGAPLVLARGPLGLRGLQLGEWRQRPNWLQVRSYSMPCLIPSSSLNSTPSRAPRHLATRLCQQQKQYGNMVTRIQGACLPLEAQHSHSQCAQISASRRTPSASTSTRQECRQPRASEAQQSGLEDCWEPGPGWTHMVQPSYGAVHPPDF